MGRSSMKLADIPYSPHLIRKNIFPIFPSICFRSTRKTPLSSFHILTPGMGISHSRPARKRTIPKISAPINEYHRNKPLPPKPLNPRPARGPNHNKPLPKAPTIAERRAANRAKVVARQPANKGKGRIDIEYAMHSRQSRSGKFYF